MRKVLIITFYFPPNPTVGSQRPYRLAKYLPKYGWEPIILTPKLKAESQPKGIRVVQTEYKDIIKTYKSKLGFDDSKSLREQIGSGTENVSNATLLSKALKLLTEIVTFPDPTKGWNRFALNTAIKLLAEEKINAVISSSPPITTHLISKKIKFKTNIPWIADLRDLWSQNHFNNKNNLLKYFERKLEFKTLSNADVLVTVTPKFVDILDKVYRNKKVILITNSYDNEDYNDNHQTKLTDKFTITYTGNFYGKKIDPSLLFIAVSELIEENKMNKNLIRIKFYSKNASWLLSDAKRYNLQDIVNYYGYIDRKDVLQKQKESQILLVLLDNQNKEISYCPAKIYEYLGARRPIIAIGGDGGYVKNLLEVTNAGKFAKNVTELKDIILRYYNEFLQSGEIKCQSNNIENYTSENMAKKYSEVLNSLIADHTE